MTICVNSYDVNRTKAMNIRKKKRMKVYTRITGMDTDDNEQINHKFS